MISKVKNMFKKLILGVSLSVVALGSAVIGFTPILKQSPKSYSNKNWMSSLSDTTLINEINMPGTHDTMALYSISDIAGKCQSLSLSDQLNIGVRFLDIRLQLVNNTLKAMHGFIDQKSTFSDIVSIVNSFLKENSSEYIIMSIKEESEQKKSNITFEEAIKNVTNKYDCFLLDNSLPAQLSSCRGKVSILSRYKNSSIGIEAFNEWSDNTTFTMSNGIHVQDHYKLDNNDIKKQDITNCFADTNTYNLKINFLSGYLKNGFPPSYAPSVANVINPWVKGEFKKYSNRGVVLFDFVNSDLMKEWFN